MVFKTITRRSALLMVLPLHVQKIQTPTHNNMMIYSLSINRRTPTTLIDEQTSIC
ncbi:hypothetical protein F441_00085 [Phytophthora nicotianae CJ01A1]|uniref:Uncharacterized protein n=2 Tax=Phytophthora nicotianae TaxID=4792 RepID=A0A080YVL3_PHYNI|nr:hypothetical protein F444_23200 [Phytophthora nicotianae P1976]ETO86370.1 hypothetical protein F444_00083 [Phytophthora nicotianae P1976]ETP27401.1 hypothetical protein F441_00085 [Phytophthora nicotianae CJ01A1]